MHGIFVHIFTAYSIDKTEKICYNIHVVSVGVMSIPTCIQCRSWRVVRVVEGAALEML